LKNGISNGYLYYRTDGSEATHFDQAKADQIANGQTRDSVLALMGPRQRVGYLGNQVADFKMSHE